MIPLDTKSIFDMGMEKWNESFQWPLSWTQFLKLEYRVKAVLNKHIQEQAEYSDLILINYKVFLDYSNLIAVLYLLKETKGNHKISDDNKYFQAVNKNGIPDLPIMQFPNFKTLPLQKRLITYIKLYLKDNRLAYPRLFGQKVHVLMEGRSHHTLEYVRKKFKGRIRTLSFMACYQKGGEQSISEQQKEKLITLSESIVKDIARVAEEYQIALTQTQSQFLVDTTCQLFEKTQVTLNRVTKGLGKRKVELFIGANRNHISRILSVVVRKNGGHVHGFTHGEPVIYDWDKISWMELSLNNFYYEYSKGLADVLAEYHKDNPIFNNQVEIRSFRTKTFKNFNRTCLKSAPHSKKRVMVMGNAIKEIEVAEVTASFAPLQLHVEMEIMKAIMNNGCSVIYKKHPGGLFTNRSIPFPDEIRVINDPFEQRYNEADILVFYNTRSTTFGYAIASNKPIIIMDIGTERIHPTLRLSLEKRCTFVKASFTEKNTLVLDDNKLQQALVNCEKFSQDYFENYLQ